MMQRPASGALAFVLFCFRPADLRRTVRQAG
jgi:hypothetical protein